MPEQVYKFCDSHGLDVLRNLELKVTPPNQFNDPFEFTPQVICSNPRKRVKDALKNKSELRDVYREEQRNGFKGDFRSYRRKFKMLLPRLMPALVESIPVANANLQRNQLDVFSQHLGVLCMSSNPHSIVMWGHYAEKHQGIVIGFDHAWEEFQPPKGMRAVRYVSERALWDTSVHRGSLEEDKAMDMVILSKNKEWDYEGELRQLYNLNGLHRRKLDNGVMDFGNEGEKKALFATVPASG